MPAWHSDPGGLWVLAHSWCWRLARNTRHYCLSHLFFARKKHGLIALLLLGSALLVPAYHIYKAELISLQKHLGYSTFFMMPVAGYALASLSGFRRVFSPGRYWLSGVAVCLVLFLA